VEQKRQSGEEIGIERRKKGDSRRRNQKKKK
jgi:hypothetical protein